MNLGMDNYLERAKIERDEKWNEILQQVPALNFDKEWGIKIIPPLAGAVARFHVEKDGKHLCSVYLDWYDKLGCVGEPYYELCPFENDTKRYLLNETEELINDIRELYQAKDNT